MEYGWLKQWFGQDGLRRGQTSRRNIASVEQFSSMQEVEGAARQRGWHVVVIGDDVVVIPSGDDIKVIC